MQKRESQEQMALFEWVQKCTNLPFIYIPNEGKRSKFAGYLMKKMGLCPGCSDIFIPRSNPRKTLHGLFIELKFGKNKATPSQIEFLNRMIYEGYGAFVCYGFEEAMLVIKEFYEL